MRALGQEGRIEFDGVHFGYGAKTAGSGSFAGGGKARGGGGGEGGEDGLVLRGLHLDVPGRHTVAFVGASGAGKSTIGACGCVRACVTGWVVG